MNRQNRETGVREEEGRRQSSESESSPTPMFGSSNSSVAQIGQDSVIQIPQAKIQLLSHAQLVDAHGNLQGAKFKFSNLSRTYKSAGRQI